METTKDKVKLVKLPDIYTRYEVRIRIRDKMCGGWPKDPGVALAMLEARQRQGLIPQEVVDRFKESIKDEAEKKTDEEVQDDAINKSWSGFLEDDEGFYIEPRHIEAMFKEAAITLGLTKKIRGSKHQLQAGFFAKSIDGRDRIHLGHKQPSGFFHQFGTATTKQGPRSFIKYYDYLEGIEIGFQIWVSDTRLITEDYLLHCLAAGSEIGLLANRTSGYGKFDVVKFDKTHSPKKTKLSDGGNGEEE